MINFSSENYDGVHPKILKALAVANRDFVPSYGKDRFTQKAIEKFKEILECDNIEVFFCFNGTGANNFAIGSLTQRHHSIFCADSSHLYTAESTAPEAFSGCRLYPVKSNQGKVSPGDISSQLTMIKGIHYPKSALLTISQPTEYGTVYTLKELREIATLCKQNHLLLHIDGARIFNALAALNCSFHDLINASRVDALTIGGTKSGLVFGEAVVLFKSHRFHDLCYNHKRSMQLASKNRFIAVQFDELFKKDLWRTIANHTNTLATHFADHARRISDIQLTQPVDTNMVFMKMRPQLLRKLSTVAGFYLWNPEQDEVRFAFSFNNTKKEIDLFLERYKHAVRHDHETARKVAPGKSPAVKQR